MTPAIQRPWYKRIGTWIATAAVSFTFGHGETLIGWAEKVIGLLSGATQKDAKGAARTLRNLRENYSEVPVLGDETLRIVAEVVGVVALLIAVLMIKQKRNDARSGTTLEQYGCDDRAIREAIARFIDEGQSLARLSTNADESEVKEKTWEWIRKKAEFFRKHLDESYVVRLQDHTGLVQYSNDSVCDSRCRRWLAIIRFRIMRLHEFLREFQSGQNVSHALIGARDEIQGLIDAAPTTDGRFSRREIVTWRNLCIDRLQVWLKPDRSEEWKTIRKLLAKVIDPKAMPARMVREIMANVISRLRALHARLSESMLK